MVESMMVNIKTIKKRDTEFFIGPTGEFIKVNGRMENKMDLVFI